jgi:shikimate kinase
MPPPRPGRGVALVGYRGTGKSTVGRLLAGQMNREFVDIDLQIEARSGRSIDAIFAELGEPTFRDWEERTLAEILRQFPGTVVATGGGSVLREQNRRRLREFGDIVWLTAHPDELTRRLLADERSRRGRPALTPAGPIEEIAQVLGARMPIYEALADFVCETDDKKPEDVVTAILKHLASRNCP